MMSRRLRAAGLVVLSLHCWNAIVRADDDSPVLSAPGDRAEAKSVAKPIAEPPAGRYRSPVLIVPGLSRGVVSKPKTQTRAPVSSTNAIPPLDPLELTPNGDPPIRSAPRSLGARSGLPLHPPADEVFDPFRDAEPLSSVSSANDSNHGRDAGEARRRPLEIDEKDDRPAVAPSRSRTRFFLWPFARRPASTASKPTSTPSRVKDVKNSVDDPKGRLTIDGEPPRADPAAESALKRTLEKRIGEVAGDRLKEIEVLVIDRRVIIRARVNRFWQRSGVRKSIESLQELSGYRATVDVN